MIRIVGKDYGKYDRFASAVAARLGWSRREAIGMIVDITTACRDQGCAELSSDRLRSIVARSGVEVVDIEGLMECLDYNRFGDYNRRKKTIQILGSGAPETRLRRRVSTYFVLADATGMVKIGRAKDVKVRVDYLQIGCPHPLRVVTKINVDCELAAHRRFHDARVQGEWFTLTGILNVIASTPAEAYDQSFLANVGAVYANG